MEQKYKPFVSVLMPAYNEQKHIGEAIKSILEQTYTNFEFVIINDCSKDNTKEIIKKFAKKDKRIKLVDNEKNLGVAKSLNKGLEICKGKYIVRMDADDWSYPYRIEKQIGFMEKNPQISVSGGAILVCDEEMKPLGVRYYIKDDKSIKETILRLNPIPHPASIWRRDSLLKTNFYPTIATVEDYGLIMEISSFSQLGNIKDVIIKFRVHSKSVSNSKMRYQQRATLYIADKGVFEFGYKRTMKDNIWKFILLITMNILPSKFKRELLNRRVLDKNIPSKLLS